MRTPGSAKELERRRLLAVRRVREGQSAAAVARFLEVNERSVRRWVERWQRGGPAALAAKAHPGPKPRLNPQQQAQVLAWLEHNPTEPGFDFATELWTAPRVAGLIRQRLGVKLSPSYLLRWLRRRGITPQMVRRRPRGHDPGQMQQWREQRWPLIRQRAAEQAARIVLIDETGLLMRPLVRRSLAPRGRPLVLKYQSKHRQKVSVQGALVMDGQAQAPVLRSRMHEDSYVDSEKNAQFLRRLLAEWPEPLMVLWDRGSMHKGPAVRAVLAEHPRLSVEYLPAYCPDLNPTEWLWSWMKYGALANFCPQDLRHLSGKVASVLAQAAEKQSMLQGFCRTAGLSPPEPMRALAA
jgi:transposase